MHRLGELALSDVDLAPIPELVEHLSMANDSVDRLLPLARSFLDEARRKALPWALARAHRAMAIVADDEEAERWFAMAMELHEDTPDVYEAARTRLAWGSRLRRARRRAAARPVAACGRGGVRAAGGHAVGGPRRS